MQLWKELKSFHTFTNISKQRQENNPKKMFNFSLFYIIKKKKCLTLMHFVGICIYNNTHSSLTCKDKKNKTS